MHRLVMLGAPGSGKGTQSKKLSSLLKIPQISTGDILRDEIKNNTNLGRDAKSYLDSGKLVPDDVIIQIVVERLNKEDCVTGYILDGYPRTIEQAKALEKNNYQLDVVISIDVNVEEIIKRLSGRRTCSKCGTLYHNEYSPPKNAEICDKCNLILTQRSDDKPDVIKSRLGVYRTQTEPLIQFYQNKKLLVNVDGNKNPDSTFENITKALLQVEK